MTTTRQAVRFCILKSAENAILGTFCQRFVKKIFCYNVLEGYIFGVPRTLPRGRSGLLGAVSSASVLVLSVLGN